MAVGRAGTGWNFAFDGDPAPFDQRRFVSPAAGTRAVVVWSFLEPDDMRLSVRQQVHGQRGNHGAGERRPQPERHIEHAASPSGSWASQATCGSDFCVHRSLRTAAARKTSLIDAPALHHVTAEEESDQALAHDPTLSGQGSAVLRSHRRADPAIRPKAPVRCGHRSIVVYWL
jgi:hypothetical protein